MSNTAPALTQALRAAQAQGLLPADAQLPAHEHRPWPVTLLTALGAWLAAIPLIAMIGMLLGEVLMKGVGPFLVGTLLLAGAATVLRSLEVPVFLEQLAVPALLVGGGSLAFGLYTHLPANAAAALLAGLALVLVFVLPQAWLRVLLGAAAAAFLMNAIVPRHGFWRDGGSVFSLWLALNLALLLWWLALALQRRALTQGSRAQLAAALESAAAGWLLMVLAGLGWWSGMTFLVGGSLGGGFFGAIATELGRRGHLYAHWWLAQAGSAMLASLAVYLLARAWPRLRDARVAAVGLVLVALSWFLPALGAVALALVCTVLSARWRLAAAAALAGAWIIGSFYYQLQWPLAHKAAILVALGAALGTLAFGMRHAPADAGASTTADSPGSRRTTLAMGLGVVLALLVANYAIWEKETLIARGEKVFVELAPVDPRSLMQGDYMRLNYRVPNTGDETLRRLVGGIRPHVIVRRDDRGVATLLRVQAPDAPLADGEMRIELTPKNGRWTLVSDAWFFREGDGRRWEAAKYGEFRVTRDGRALLVGLADLQLRTIPIDP